MTWFNLRILLHHFNLAKILTSCDGRTVLMIPHVHGRVLLITLKSSYICHLEQRQQQQQQLQITNFSIQGSKLVSTSVRHGTRKQNGQTVPQYTQQINDKINWNETVKKCNKLEHHLINLQFVINVNVNFDSERVWMQTTARQNIKNKNTMMAV